jgi:two-component system phosphate regulon response regulator PhoB
MVKEHILVVDDEENIRELLQYSLAKQGYQVTPVATGEDALAACRNESPDLILLDLMLPGIDGLEVCRSLKANPKTSHVPIVMLTARGEEVDIVSGLELGADDYVTKPFSPRVLLARVRNVLRKKSRPGDEEQATVQVHRMMIHPGRQEVLIEGQPVELTCTEFRLLHLLARRAGWVFTRKQIIDAVRGDDYPVTDRSVDVQIVGLRKKLGAHGQYIETVRGVGYRLKE